VNKYRHTFLSGVAALQGARLKLEELRKNFDDWAEVSEGPDFDK
jgi:hypothetical protein